MANGASNTWPSVASDRMDVDIPSIKSDVKACRRGRELESTTTVDSLS